MTCPGSIAAEEGLADETSVFAAEGTFAHDISDMCLSLGFDAWDFIGHRADFEGHTFEWTDDDAANLQPGIEQTRAFGGKFYSEHRVDLSHFLGPNQFGTLDRGIITPEMLIVSDLKWGRGQAVEAVGNKQLRLYALGFWWNVARHVSDAKRVLIVVDQPRCVGGGGEWEITLDELLAFGEEAKAAAAAAMRPDAPLIASEKGCKWCKRRSAPGGCGTYDKFMVNLLGMQFEDLDEAATLGLDPPLETAMTPERRAYVVRHRGAIGKWLDQLHGAHLGDALRGAPSGDLKAVAGRKSPDKWSDPVKAADQLEAILGDEGFKRTIKTPTQVSKEIDLDAHPEVKELIEVGEKKPVLVDVADARPAVTLGQDFDDLD